MNCSITAEELIRLNELARVHESTAIKRSEDPKSEGLEMEYASRLMAIRKLFGIETLSNTFRVPIFNPIETPAVEQGQSPP